MDHDKWHSRSPLPLVEPLFHITPSCFRRRSQKIAWLPFGLELTTTTPPKLAGAVPLLPPRRGGSYIVYSSSSSGVYVISFCTFTPIFDFLFSARIFVCSPRFVNLVIRHDLFVPEQWMYDAAIDHLTAINQPNKKDRINESLMSTTKCTRFQGEPDSFVHFSFALAASLVSPPAKAVPHP